MKSVPDISGPTAPAAAHGPPGSPLSRVRVALFSGNYNYTRDGSNQALNRLVGHLERCGAEVRVYSPTARTPAFAPTGRLVPAPSVPIPFRSDYRLAIGLTPRLRADLDAFGPDLIHVSAPDPLGAGALAYARRRGLPVIASIHTAFETYLQYYRLGWLRRRLEGRLKAFYAACDYVLAPNAAMAERYAATGLGERMRIWSRGVDTDLFAPARRDPAWRRAQGFGDDALVVAYFGRVVIEKGLKVFVEAFERLQAQEPRARALVIGDGPARALLQKRLPQAVFAGSLTGPALGRAVASSDILMNTSVTETFNNVVLEAMAAGLALVCADAPANRALIEDGVSGLLVEPRDPDAYADAVVGLARDPGRAARLGAAARDASAAYSWTASLDAVVRVYGEALNRRAALAA
jgi:glycosyltransferase involved in cell wall biosynthesis